MVKNKQEIKKELKHAHKGTLSTIIITVFILGFGWFFPMVISTRLEDARRGESFWIQPDVEIKEFLLWSIESNADFNSVTMKQDSDDGYYNTYHQWGSGHGSYGVEYYKTGVWNRADGGSREFTNYWMQRTRLSNSQGRWKMVYNDITYAYTDTQFPDSDKIEGNYLVGNCIDDVSLHSSFHPNYNPLDHSGYKNINDAHSGHYYSEQLHYWLKLDIDEWIDNDATTLRTYIKFEATYDYTRFQVRAYSQVTGAYRTIDTQVINTSPGLIVLYLESDITLADMVAIQNLVSDGDICLRIKYHGTNSGGSDVKTAGMYRNALDPVLFDASVYGLIEIEEEIKYSRPLLTSMDRFSIYMILTSFCMFVLGLAMLPMFSMGGLMRTLRLLPKKDK